MKKLEPVELSEITTFEVRDISNFHTHGAFIKQVSRNEGEGTGASPEVFSKLRFEVSRSHSPSLFNSIPIIMRDTMDNARELTPEQIITNLLAHDEVANIQQSLTDFLLEAMASDVFDTPERTRLAFHYRVLSDLLKAISQFEKRRDVA